MRILAAFAAAVALLNLVMWAGSGNAVALVATITNGLVALAALGAWHRQRAWRL